MKGTSAPQTGDIKAGQGIGNAQVWDLSAKDKRINDLVDRDLDAKAAEKEKEDKRQDEFLKATDTSGMWQDEVPDMLAEINEFKDGVDMRKYNDDPVYRSEVDQQMQNIKQGISFSVADKKAYNDAMKLWEQFPEKYEKPEITDYVQGSARGGNYGALKKSNNLKAKHQFKEYLPDIIKDFAELKSKNTTAYANAIRSGTMTTEEVNEVSIKAMVDARIQDPAYRADFIERMKRNGLEPDNSTPEGKKVIDDYINTRVRELVVGGDSEQTADFNATSNDTEKGKLEEQEKFNNFWAELNDLGENSTEVKQQLIGQNVNKDKRKKWKSIKPNPNGTGFIVTYETAVGVKTGKDGIVISVDSWEESEPVEMTTKQLKIQGFNTLRDLRGYTGGYRDLEELHNAYKKDNDQDVVKEEYTTSKRIFNNATFVIDPDTNKPKVDKNGDKIVSKDENGSYLLKTADIISSLSAKAGEKTSGKKDVTYEEFTDAFGIDPDGKGRVVITDYDPDNYDESFEFKYSIDGGEPIDINTDTAEDVAKFNKAIGDNAGAFDNFLNMGEIEEETFDQPANFEAFKNNPSTWHEKQITIKDVPVGSSKVKGGTLDVIEEDEYINGKPTGKKIKVAYYIKDPAK